VLQAAREEAAKVAGETSAATSNTTKDDIARLIHLFKEPSAQVHWSNHFGVLNRAQLDARRSAGAVSEAANPLGCLAAIFNDYDSFTPQNLMVAYTYDRQLKVPVKKVPYQASSEEWSELANHTHDIDPTNLSRRNVLREAGWIKSTWNDCRRFLHQVFQQYNRSGQHDPEKGEWCSEKERQRWIRAALWRSSGSNTIVRYPTVMMYSICILDQGDFEGIGRQMPSGTGIDNSVADGNAAPSAKRRRGKYRATARENDNNSSQLLLQTLEGGTKSETKMTALRLMLEFGSNSQKANAMKEVQRIAFGDKKKRKTNNQRSTTEEEEEASTNEGDDEAEEVATQACSEDEPSSDEDDEM
jgi:hypothetical protein